MMPLVDVVEMEITIYVISEQITILTALQAP